MNADSVALEEVFRGLIRGDFSALDPLLEGHPSKIVQWVESGCFEDQPRALAEALSCACFNGRTEVARYLLDRGVDPAAGNGTGLDATHWAANRGQLATVKLLIERGAPLETVSMHGTTVLRTAVWSAQNESKPDHPAIIEALIAAGADISKAGYPTGDRIIDEILESSKVTKER